MPGVSIGFDQTNHVDAPHHRLIMAAHHGHLHIVRDLLDRELTAPIDLACHDVHGRTALHLASWNGHLEIVRLLLERGAAWHAQDTEKLTAGEYALLEGHRDVYEELLSAGIRAELVLNALHRAGRSLQPDQTSAIYLDGFASYSDDKLIDADKNGVMMSWETPLMAAHAEAMNVTGRDVLNIGFGMGIIDSIIQQHSPRSHTIVEAHPDVYKRMIVMGIHNLPNVRIIFGRWQDKLAQISDMTYHAIMFDTFGESDHDLNDFHEVLLDLLDPSGTYTFFNGLAATNSFFHDVCCEVTRLSLAEFGLSTTYVPIPIDTSDAAIWAGVKDRYWNLTTYQMPICKFQM